jgi:hypothetical protein
MGFGSDEYIDYTLLRKKGILKLPAEKELPIKCEGGFIDFTAFRSPQAPEPATEAKAECPAPNFDFLNNMAGVGASAPAGETTNPLANFETYGGSTPGTSNAEGKEFEHLKVKMDDMEYKLDRFIERLDKLEEKLGRVNLG